MKICKRVLVVFLLILFSPLLLVLFVGGGLFILIAAAISWPILGLEARRNYKKSQYFRELGVPYRKHLMDGPSYAFYNAYGKHEDVTYVRQNGNSFEYFVYGGTVYLFPDFNCLKFCQESMRWKTVYRTYSEEEYGELGDYIETRRGLLEESVSSLPIKVIIDRKRIQEPSLEGLPLPSEAWIVKHFETAFRNEHWRSISIVPQNLQELYDLLLETPDLLGYFEMREKEECICWEHGELSLRFDLDNISVYKKSDKGKPERYLTHWHPDFEEVYDDVCRIARKGSVLVVKMLGGTTHVAYSGEKEGCPAEALVGKKHSKIHVFEVN